MVTFLLAALTVFIQDIEKRAISWWLIPVVFITLFGLSCEKITLWDAVYTVVINGVLLTVILGGLSGYLKLKSKCAASREIEYFGLGDVLILYAITPALDYTLFIAFLIVSGVVMLFIWWLLTRWLPMRDRTVPYAGFLCLMLSLLLSVSWINPELDLVRLTFLPNILFV